MKASKRPMIFILLFWAGFVSSISFMEAWLKFRADGVTREIGLSIGKLIFTALNRVEIMLLIAIWIIYLTRKVYRVALFKFKDLWLWMLTALVSLQTFWLLPALSHNAEIIINGGHAPSPLLHLWFGLFEISKVFLLLMVSYKISKDVLMHQSEVRIT